MADVDITSLSVEISAESQGAELNIDKLATAISNLRTKGNVTKVVNSLDKLAGSIATLKQASAGMSGLDKITSFLNGLSNFNPTARNHFYSAKILCKTERWFLPRNRLG